MDEAKKTSSRRLSAQRRLVLRLVFGLGVVFASPALQAQANPSLESAIEHALATVRKQAPAPGVAVGIMREGKMILVKNYGLANLEDNTPVGDDTSFRIGSVSKEFTATGIVILAEQGKLGLDDALWKFLPDFPRAKEVTLRQLLNHTSGLHNYTVPGWRNNLARLDLTTAEMVKRIAEQDPLYDFEPGTQWNYSSSGYYILGAIIEQVSGSSLDDFLQANIFSKAGMTHSAVDVGYTVVPHRASPYTPDAKAPSGFVNSTPMSMTTTGGAGAIRSTVADLLRFQAALFGGMLVSPEGLRQMLTPGRLRNGQLAASSSRPPAAPDTASAAAPSAKPSEYGFGLEIGELDGATQIGHTGHVGGFNAFLKTYPTERLTIAVLANGDTGTAVRLGAMVARIMLQSSHSPAK